MSMSVTSTYTGTGVNAGDVLIQLQDYPLSASSGPGKFVADLLPQYYNWMLVSTVGAVTVEITFDAVNWLGPVAIQDMTSTAALTYVTVTTVNKPCTYFGNVRGIRIKQSGAPAATAQLMGWGWGVF